MQAARRAFAPIIAVAALGFLWALPVCLAGQSPVTAVEVAKPNPTQFRVMYYHGAMGITIGWVTIGNGMVEFSDPKGKQSFEIRVSDIEDLEDRSGGYRIRQVRIKVKGNRSYDLDNITQSGEKKNDKERAASLIDCIKKEQGAKALPADPRPSVPPVTQTSEISAPTRFRVGHGHGLSEVDKGWISISEGVAHFRADAEGQSLDFRVNEIQEAKPSYGFLDVKLRNGKKYDFVVYDDAGENQVPPDAIIAAIQRAGAKD
ncbi:MAG: hypothetical protein ABSF46_01435 [Terriglobia bacterium]|jgi:hypothetical protein